jgi:hypothetical protein
MKTYFTLQKYAHFLYVEAFNIIFLHCFMQFKFILIISFTFANHETSFVHSRNIHIFLFVETFLIFCINFVISFLDPTVS